MILHNALFMLKYMLNVLASHQVSKATVCRMDPFQNVKKLAPNQVFRHHPKIEIFQLCSMCVDAYVYRCALLIQMDVYHCLSF